MAATSSRPMTRQGLPRDNCACSLEFMCMFTGIQLSVPDSATYADILNIIENNYTQWPEQCAGPSASPPRPCTTGPMTRDAPPPQREPSVSPRRPSHAQQGPAKRQPRPVATALIPTSMPAQPRTLLSQIGARSLRKCLEGANTPDSKIEIPTPHGYFAAPRLC